MPKSPPISSYRDSAAELLNVAFLWLQSSRISQMWWHCLETWSILQLAMDPCGVLVKYQDSMWTSQGLGKDGTRTEQGLQVDSMRSHQPNGQFPVHLQSTFCPLPVQSTWSPQEDLVSGAELFLAQLFLLPADMAIGQMAEVGKIVICSKQAL